MKGKILWLGILLLVPGIGASQTKNIDWDSINGRDVNLFYPGQASWEWLLTKHSAAKSVRKGSICRECHANEEPQMGKTIVSGKKLEPSPINGKPGSIKVNIKATYDNDNIYIRAQWGGSGFSSGQVMDKKYATKFAMMIDDGKVKEAPVAGCWGACHTDASNMPAHEGNARQLYLSASRQKLTRNGGGDNFIDPEDMIELRESGVFMEYWQARYSKNLPSKVYTGYILDKRHEHVEPVTQGNISVENGRWTADFVRPRSISGKGIKNLKNTEHLYVGFALHDDYVVGRHHYVSFGYSLGLGSDADIKATKR